MTKNAPEKVTKNLGRALLPPHLEKIQKNSSFSQATFPNHRNKFDQMTVALIILDFLGLRIELGGSVKRCLTGWQQLLAKMMTLILIMCVSQLFSFEHDFEYDDHIDSMRI